jgi:hypothetical protein
MGKELKLRLNGSAQVPKGDDAQNHEIGEKERADRRGAVDEIVEGLNRGTAEITWGVQGK